VSRPLAGAVVVVTRPRAQAGPLVDALVDAGARVRELPLIEIAPVDDPAAAAALRALERYAAVVVTSANGAAALADRLAGLGVAVPESVVLVAVGDATAAVLARNGIAVGLVPPVATGAGVAAALVRRGVAGRRVLLARAREGRPELPAGLRAAGAVVDDVALYETVRRRPDGAELSGLAGADAIVLTAPSAVASLVAAGTPLDTRTRVVTIGPTTSAAVRSAGMSVAAEAVEQSAAGLVAAVVAALRPPA
jgi:uroporphyrinogen III methyltransferase/synthase